MKHDSLNQIMALSYACNTMILQSENRLLVLWLGMINLLYILIEKVPCFYVDVNNVMKKTMQQMLYRL